MAGSALRVTHSALSLTFLMVLAVCTHAQGGKTGLNPFDCISSVRCADTCASTTCSTLRSGATCYQNLCTEQTLNGLAVPSCTPVWVYPSGKAVVCNELNCGSLSTVKCAADACAVTPADCPAANTPGATCEISSCLDGFLSDLTKVPACTAMWRQADGSLALCPEKGTGGTRGAVGAQEPTQEELICPGGSTVKCSAAACDPANLPTDCQAAREPGATCEIASCLAGRLADGTKVPACSAMWRQADGSLQACVTPRKDIGNGDNDIGPDDKGGDSEVDFEDCTCPMLYQPVCGKDGKSYGNACVAACAKAEVERSGECLPQCPPGPVATCLLDPCTPLDGSKPYCPADPAATCHSNYCAEATYMGRPLGACTAVWLDTYGKLVQDCYSTAELTSSDGGGSSGSTGTGGGTGAVAGGGSTDPWSGPGDEALNPFSGCIGNVRCAKNSCLAPRCADASPNSACFQLTCSGQQLNGVPVDACSAVWVDPKTKEAVACGGSGEEEEPCTCTKELVPVCGSNGVTYGNKCLAACALGAEGTWTSGACPLRPACICTKEYRPVCGSDGTTYGNKCMAACALGPTGKWTTGACDGGTSEPGVISCPSGTSAQCLVDPCTVVPPDCKYAALDSAQCGASYCNDGVLPDGTQIGPCTAVFTLASGDMVVCPSGPDGGGDGGGDGDGDGNGCACITLYDPVCGVDGKTYGNGCSAGCAKVAVAYRGECIPTCEQPASCLVDPCSLPPPGTTTTAATPGSSTKPTCAASPAATCYSSYCPGVEYQGVTLGACAAVWLDPNGRLVEDCSRRPATDPDYEETYALLNPFAGCIGDVRCAKDSCQWPRCAATSPNSTCFMTTCTGQSLDGQPVAPCSAVWVDRTTRKAVVCPTGGDPEPTVSCPGGVTAACFANPCDAVSKTDCRPANIPGATCEPSYCEAGVLPDGSKIGPCTAVFHLPTGGLATCPAATNSSGSGCMCDLGYRPVCGVDGKTYGNACSARCARVAVARHGECGAALPPSPVCRCTREYMPVCGSDSVTYPNKCLAACALGAEGKWTVGACNTTQHGEGCSCIELWKPVCGVDGKTYGNDCQAGCAKVDIQHVGTCLPSCPIGPSAKCQVNPCLVSKPCRADPPVAACTYTDCLNATYSDGVGGAPTSVLPCAPVWLDANGGLVDCSGGGGVGGVGNVTCTSCTTEYAPVCGTDGITYPNKCAAACLRVAVARVGKCSHCNGGECTIGKKNDLCFLGARNCWAKKYACGLPAGGAVVVGGSPAVFGKCLPKEEVQGGHHHHHRHLARAMLADEHADK